jgi:hypothetical protein
MDSTPRALRRAQRWQDVPNYGTLTAARRRPPAFENGPVRKYSRPHAGSSDDLALLKR